MVIMALTFASVRKLVAATLPSAFDGRRLARLRGMAACDQEILCPQGQDSIIAVMAAAAVIGVFLGQLADDMLTDDMKAKQ